MAKDFIDNTVLVLFNNADMGRDYENQAEIEAVDEQLAREGHSPNARSKFWRDTKLQLSRTKRLQEAQGAQAFLDVTKKTEEMIAMLVTKLEKQRSANTQTRSAVRNSTQTKLWGTNE